MRIVVRFYPFLVFPSVVVIGALFRYESTHCHSEFEASNQPFNFCVQGPFAAIGIPFLWSLFSFNSRWDVGGLWILKFVLRYLQGITITLVVGVRS